MGNLPKLLVVDDEVASANAIARTLRKDFEVLKAYNGQEALKLLQQNKISVIISDQRMPHMTGIEFFEKSLKNNPDSIRILITGYSDLEAVIQAINAGQIYYYIEKPWEPSNLRIVAKQALEKYNLIKENKLLIQQLKKFNNNLKEENTQLKDEVKKQYNFDNIIGTSPKIKAIFQTLTKIIPTNLSILITGATGTGKELIAKAVHYNSQRQQQPFLAINCAALTDTLLESKLFGHVKGSFTGATNNQNGVFKQADGGTIFLDEIGDTSPDLQKRLLRVLQEGEFTPVGSEKIEKVNVRIIAATNKNLEEEIKNGNFREDLFFRLNEMPVHLPSLKDRIEDIEPLTNFFIKKFSLQMGKQIKPLNQAVLTILQNYSFPGNIRELENIIRRCVALSSEEGIITREMVIINNSDPSPQITVGKTLKDKVELLEQKLIKETLKKCNGNISKAADELGLSRVGLHKKLKRYSIIAK